MVFKRFPSSYNFRQWFINKSISNTQFTPSGSDQFWAIQGGENDSALQTASDTGDTRLYANGILSMMSIDLDSNSNCSVEVTMKTQIGSGGGASSDGNQSITIPALASGTFQDTSNVDIITAPTFVRYAFTSAAGTGNLERMSSGMIYSHA